MSNDHKFIALPIIVFVTAKVVAPFLALLYILKGDSNRLILILRYCILSLKTELKVTYGKTVLKWYMTHYSEGNYNVFIEF